jgi:hypothetical protein
MNNGMKIGLRLPQTGEHRTTKENIIHLAKRAENAGFDSRKEAATGYSRLVGLYTVFLFI